MHDDSRPAFLRRFAAGIASLGALSAERASAQEASKLTPVRIAVTAGDGNTAGIYAKYAGTFEKAGLDVQLQAMANGSAVAAAVVSGAFDIGTGGVTSVFLAHEKGLPFVFIAPGGLYDARAPYDGAIVLKDATLTLGKDVENQIVGTVSLQGIGHDAICAWIDQHGGDPSKVRFTEVPYSAVGAALLQHRVVAAETITPSMSAALDTGMFRLIPVLDAIGKLYIQSAWFTTRDYSAKNPEVVRKFAQIMAATSAYVNAHHEETAPVVSRFSGIPLNIIQHMPRATEGITLSADLLQPPLNACAKYGSLKKAFPAREVIDPLVANLQAAG